MILSIPAVVLFGLGVLVPAAKVVAQTAEPVLEEIIVTAQKREERLLDVPLAVSVIDDGAIRRARVNTLADVAMLTPGVEIGNSIGRQTGIISIRGVNPGVFGNPTVLVYQDGFTMGNSRVLNNGILFDLERIEILKGPQATLYGRNALGGVINYVTRRPGNKPEGFLTTSYGNFDTLEVTGSVSGPLVKDRLFARLSGQFQSHDGYWDNQWDGERNINDEEDKNLRAAFAYDASEDLTLDLTVSYAKSDDDCGDCPNFPDSYDPANPAAVGQGLVDMNEYQQRVNQDVLGYFKREVTQTVLTINYDFESFSLTSISGYGKMESELEVDQNRAPGPMVIGGVLPVEFFQLPIDLDVFSQEVRLTSADEGRFRWMLGGYYFRDETHGIVSFFLTPPLDFLNPLVFGDSAIKTRNYALFANASFDISERLKLAAGIRYDYEKQELDDFLNLEQRAKDGSEWLPTASLSYRVTEDTNLYVSATKGYKAGGFNNSDQPVLEYDPEFLWNYELGIKGRFADGSARYELTAFYMDWSDQQVNRASVTGGFTVNAAQSTIKGIEALLGAMPLPGLNLSASATYTDAQYDEYIDETFVPLFFGLDPDYSGNDIPLTPDWTLALSADYLYPLGNTDGWGLRTRVDARYTGERNFHASGAMPQDSYALVNLYLGVESQRYEIGFFAQNLFDKGYHVFGDLAVGLPPLLWTGPPRVYGIRARLNF